MLLENADTALLVLQELDCTTLNSAQAVNTSLRDLCRELKQRAGTWPLEKWARGHYESKSLQVPDRCCGYDRGVSSVATDGPFIASGCRDGTSSLWHVSSGLIAELSHEAEVTCVALRAGHLATGCRDGLLRKWQPDEQPDASEADLCPRLKRLPDFEVEAHDGCSMLGLAWASPTSLVSSGTDRTLRLWSGATGECFRSCQMCSAALLALGGGLIATSSRDFSITLRRAVSLEQVRAERLIRLGPDSAQQPRDI